MHLCSDYELVEIAKEHLAVPVGKTAEELHSIVVLNEPAALLLENMNEAVSIEQLVQTLTDNYNVDKDQAYGDIVSFLSSLKEMGLVID